jgi:hypothetical protein
MKKLLIFTLLVWSVNCFANPVEIELKGIKLGSNLEDFLKVYPWVSPGWSSSGYGARCHKSSPDFDVCEYSSKDMEPFTIVGLSTDPTYLFKESKLVRINSVFSYPDESYPKLLSAFSEKYGQPSRVIEDPIRTGNGVEYQNKIAQWDLPDGSIQLTKYHGAINRSYIEFKSNSYIQYEKELKARDNEKLSKDL